MTSREKILREIKNNKPLEIPMPDVELFQSNEGNVKEKFINTIVSIGALCTCISSLDEWVKVREPLKPSTVVVQIIKDLPGYNAEAYLNANANTLKHVNTVYIKGALGVAENGAVWVSEADMGNRILPFICENLLLIINGFDIVDTMHQAYEKISMSEIGYGTFIAGPSKTADIEQSLVIGAHGPLSLEVIIVG